MQANPLALLDRAPPLLPADARFVPFRRQVLALGPVRIERAWRMAGAIPADADMCRVTFRPSSAAGGRVPGTWSAGIAGALPAEAACSGEIVALAFPADHLSRGLAAQVQAGGTGGLPIQGPALVCLEMARLCLAQADGLGPAVAEALGDSLVELAKLAIVGQVCTRRHETVRETMRTRIRAFIHRNLADPDLTIERIAERMQCTKRYLHKVFSDEGETLNQYIWAQRLELCRKHLSQAELAGKSITEIAFACGFSNAAHFSRSFRARFGQPPRVFRSAALGLKKLPS